MTINSLSATLLSIFFIFFSIKLCMIKVGAFSDLIRYGVIDIHVF